MWFTAKRRGYNEAFFFALSCATERGENVYYKWHQRRGAPLEDISDVSIFDLRRDYGA